MQTANADDNKIATQKEQTTKKKKKKVKKLNEILDLASTYI